MSFDNDQDRLPPALDVRRPVPERLRKRPDFLRVSKGRRFFAPAFALQAAPRPEDGSDGASVSRFGLTITKKTGTAVERNRMRRRLREAIRQANAMDARPGCDYVIVAQRTALSLPFASLVGDIEKAVAEINRRLDKPAPPRRPNSGQGARQPERRKAAKQVGTGSDQ